MLVHPAHLQARQVRDVVLQTTPHYLFLHPSPSVRFWRDVCHGSLCDQYSVGDGYCLVQAVDQVKLEQLRPLGAEDFARLMSTHPYAVLGSNCNAGDLGVIGDAYGARPGVVKGQSPPAQLFHCPKEVPVAIMVIPKCGKTSTVNWAYAMEGDWEDASLAYASQLLLHRGHNRLNAFVQQWLYPELERSSAAGAKFTGNLTDIDAELNELLRRTISKYRFQTSTGDTFSFGVIQQFLPPAHLCATCCLHAHGRQHVVVARNPFVRLVSYFRYRWLNSMQLWTQWIDFSPWLTNLMNVRDDLGPHGFAFRSGRSAPSHTQCDRHGIASPSSCKKVDIDESEIFHVRPLGDMARDERFVAGPAAFEKHALHVVHLETLHEDISELNVLLCRRFNFCGRDLQFPDRVLPNQNILDGRSIRERCVLNEHSLQWTNCTAPPWLELWSPNLAARFSVAYADDFRWLGYSIDPSLLLPQPGK